MKKLNFTMFVVKLGTPSRANYEYFHVYLAYRRQTGTVMTRQTYDRAPRLTRPPTAHISRGDYVSPIVQMRAALWSFVLLCIINQATGMFMVNNSV